MRRRPRTAVEGLAQTRQSLGDGTLQGRSRIATPYSRRNLAPQPSTRTVVNGGPSGGVGETICLTATAHAAAGLVTFDAEPVWRTGFGTFDTGGATTTRRGYYAASISLVADGMIDSGSVAVYVDGVESVGPPIDNGLTLDGCDEFRDTIHLPETAPGQELSLYVDPGGTSIDVVVTFLLVETTASLVANPPVEQPDGLTVDATGRTTGAQFSLDTTPVTVPAGDAGDLLVFIASAASWDFDSGVPSIGDVVSSLAWTVVERDASQLSGDHAGKASVWMRIAQAGDGGETVNATIGPGTASGHRPMKSVWRIPYGTASAIGAHTADLDIGASPVPVTPAGVVDAGKADVVVLVGVQDDPAPTITSPAGITTQASSTRSGNRHTIALPTTQGSEQTWSFSWGTGQLITGFAWRVRITA